MPRWLDSLIGLPRRLRAAARALHGGHHLHAASDTPPPVRGLRGARSVLRRRLVHAKHTRAHPSRRVFLPHSPSSPPCCWTRATTVKEPTHANVRQTTSCCSPLNVYALGARRCVRRSTLASKLATSSPQRFFHNNSYTNDFFPQLLVPRPPGWRQRCALKAAAGRERQAGVSLQCCAPFRSCATSDVSPPTWRNIRQPTAHDTIWALLWMLHQVSASSIMMSVTCPLLSYRAYPTVVSPLMWHMVRIVEHASMVESSSVMRIDLGAKKTCARHAVQHQYRVPPGSCKRRRQQRRSVRRQVAHSFLSRGKRSPAWSTVTQVMNATTENALNKRSAVSGATTAK